MNFIKYSKRNILVLFRILIIPGICLSPSLLWATPDYSEKTEQGCKICHLDEAGGKLSIKGLEFAASGYVWPAKGGYRVLGPIRKTLRLILGIFHILAAFMWFGTILYVHLVLRPGYAASGLPKGEVALGMVSMAVVGISGILLTVSKIKSIDVLYMSPWGIALSIKIILYIIMVSSALFVVLFVGPKLKKGLKKTATLKTKVFDAETLLTFDGKDGMPVYIAYKGKVYDVTALKRWKNGTHMNHSSAHDLTDYLAKAPHGAEKLDSLKVVGSYDAGLSPPKTFAQMAFYFIAYMNLIIVFCVLFVIAYWRWGL